MIAILLLASPAQAQHCALPAVLSALQGRGPAPSPYALTPPPNLDGRPRPAPPSAKQILGTPYETHYETANFTINLVNGTADQALLERTGEALEAGWTVMVEQDGWQPPVSSDHYLIWVLLDDVSIGGGTGLTTEYTSADYPDGYPVIYLNPSYESYVDFWEALAIHEFAHSLQFAVRDWNGGDDEAWYWEASAMWADEQVVPDNDTYGDQAWYYSNQPGLRFDSTAGYHQYGMVVLNASLEQSADQRGRVQAVWTAAADRPGDPWDAIIADTLESTPAQIWSDFTGPMGNQALPESSIYEPVVMQGTLSEGDTLRGTVPYLGTHYYSVAEQIQEVLVSGDVTWSGGSYQPDDLSIGEVLAITGLAADGADYEIETWRYPSDSGDGGGDGDGGGGGDVTPFEDPEPGRSCGCAIGATTPFATWSLVLLTAARRRR